MTARSFSRLGRGLSHHVWCLLAVALLCTLVPPAAHAQLAFTLTPNFASGIPGQTLTFTGDLRNIGTNVIALSGGTGNIAPSSADAVWEDSDFNNNLPFTLNPGDQYSRSLFLQLSSSAMPGLISAEYAVDGIDTVTFNGVTGNDFAAVTILPGSNIAPEPDTRTFLLPLLALFVVIGAWRRRRFSPAALFLPFIACFFAFAPAARADVLITYTETVLGPSSFRYDYTYYNTFDPILNPGADLVEVDFGLDGSTNTTVLSTGLNWGTNVDPNLLVTNSILVGEPPFGSDIAPSSSLSGFSFVFDKEVGPLPFTATVLGFDLINGTAQNAGAAAPEPQTWHLVLMGMTLLVAGWSHLRRSGSR